MSKRSKPDPLKAEVVNRQYEAASRLAKRLDTTPEELLDPTLANRLQRLEQEVPVKR